MKGGVSRGAARLLLASGLLLGASGCRTGKGDPSWIGPDAAAVRCTVAGPNRIMPPILLELPHPPPPEGMYVRSFDPVALTDLGYQRDTVVCAALQSPSPGQLVDADKDLLELRRVRDEVSESARKLGECACDTAAHIGRKALIQGCMDQKTNHSCRVDRASIEKMEQTLAPLEVALAEVDLPVLHWRLFGISDRPGWFVDRFTKLVGRYEGGSTIYGREEPVAEDVAHALTRALLAEPDVVAVVRQDGGRAHLVVRELPRGRLVFDYFRYAVDDLEAVQLMGSISASDLDVFRQAMKPPEQAVRPELDPRDGPLIVMDLNNLERVDQMLSLHARFDTRGYDLQGEVRERPLPLVDRAEIQVPFGHDGEKLDGRFRLSAEGSAWMAAVRDMPLPAAAEDLRLDPAPPRFEPSPNPPDYVLRGTPVDHVWFLGVHGLAEVFDAMEREHPGKLEGTPAKLQLPIPSGPMPMDLGTREGLRPLRERLSKRSHELTVAEDGGWLTVILDPD